MSLWVWAAALGWVMTQAASAALWGHVDGHGVAHFSSAQTDPRYQLVLADRVAAGGATNATASAAKGRVPGKADAAASVLIWLDIAPEVKAVMPWLREAARLHSVDTELLKAVIAVESGFNAKAVSPKGAVGLMQITPDTADRYATAKEKLVPAAQRLLDPRTKATLNKSPTARASPLRAVCGVENPRHSPGYDCGFRLAAHPEPGRTHSRGLIQRRPNVLTGARMLSDLTRRYARIDHALAAWSAGEGAVRRAGGVPAIDETRAHVHLVLELYWALLQDRQAMRATRIELK